MRYQHVTIQKTNKIPSNNLLRKREHKSRAIQFKPKLENHISNQIDITINKKHISINIDEERHIINIPKNYKPQDYIKNSTQFFNDIINNSNANVKTKMIYRKYIYMIADKISYHKIKKIWAN